MLPPPPIPLTVFMSKEKKLLADAAAPAPADSTTVQLLGDTGLGALHMTEEADSHVDDPHALPPILQAGVASCMTAAKCEAAKYDATDDEDIEGAMFVVRERPGTR